MKVLYTMPLFAVVLIIYNIAVFAGSSETTPLASVAFEFGLPSGANLVMAWSDIVLSLGVVLLFVEVVKATRTGSVSIADHGMSMAVFVVFLVEFIVVTRCGTAAFFVLMLMSLLDVLAGFTISIVAARRDLAVSPPIG